MADQVFIKGLKLARFGFSEVLDHLKADKEVIVIEYNRAREPVGAYRMVKMPDDEAMTMIKTHPALNIPKPLEIPTPDMVPLP